MRYKALLARLIVAVAVLSVCGLVLGREVLTNDQTHGIVNGTADFEASSAVNTGGDQSVEPLAQTDTAAPGEDMAADASSCGGNAPGMADPAAVYCGELGYSYGTASADEGQYGICVFPDGSRCDAWRFLEGKCGQGYSYCARQGYGLITKTDGKNPFSRDYSVCVNGQVEIGPVTELMDLGKRATRGTVSVEQTPAPVGEEPPVGAPSSFDWRNHNDQNWMTSVKNQGSCGSCWAFSAVGVVEAVYNIGWNDPNLDWDLSEEYLVSDCHSYGGAQNCCGGWKDIALQYIRDSGISDEACFPYVDGSSCTCGTACNSDCTYPTGSSCSDATCSNRCADWASRLKRISSTGYVGASSIKDNIVQKGPLAVSMGIESDYGGWWDGDIYRCTNDSGTNHAVIIVGYNDAGGYWIVKNSWGTSWPPTPNDGGYFKVGYGECAIENYVYYAVPQTQPCPPGQYSLSMQVSPAGAGTTDPSAGDLHCYASGTTVPVQATDASGWDFHHWSGDCSGTNPSTSVQMTSNKTCVANFAHEGCVAYTSSDVPKPISDYTTTLSTLNVGDAFTLNDVNVALSITHTWDSDLVATLISPLGTRVTLFDYVGSSGDNFTDTVLDDECTTPISSGTAPFTGCYQPEGSLNDFDGESSSGVWTLEIYDAAGGDSGTLNSWALELCGAPPAVDLTVTKTASPADGSSVPTGSTITYTLTTANSASSTGTATNVPIRDYIGTGLTLSSVTPGTGVTCSDTTPPEINCTAASIGPGASRTVTIAVTVTATGGTVLNGARVDPASVIAETNEDADDPDRDCTTVGEGTDAAPATEPDNFDCTSHSIVNCDPGVDTDSDSFDNDIECYLGTDPLDACPDDPTDDAWPLDMNMDGQISIVGDVLNFNGCIGATPGAPNWWQRLDFNADGQISVVGDVLKYRGMIGETCE